MSLLLIILVLILLFGGGGYAGYRGNCLGGRGLGVGGFILLVLILYLVFGSPHSAYAADGGTTVSSLPLYRLIEPYVITFVGAATPVLLAWGLAMAQSHLSFLKGVRLTDQAKASVQQAAENAAGRVLAKAEGPVASLKFDTHSPAIALEITKLQTSVGGAIDKLGMTPDRVADLVLGKVGQLQAAATTISPAAIPIAKATPQVGL